MTTPSTSTAVTADADARREILEQALVADHPAVVVDSPPGAGKTALVEAAVAVGVLDRGLRVSVIAPRNEQVFDIVRRLRDHYRDMPMQLLHSAQAPVPEELRTAPGLVCQTDPQRLAHGPGVVVATAAKLSISVPHLSSGEFDILVCDEAYQLAWKDLMPILHLSSRHLLVGDPGQLRPIVRGDLARYEGARHKVHWPAPQELLRQHPLLPRLALPATWRLPQDTVDFVQSAFYPQLPFVSGVDPALRRIEFGEDGGGDPLDRALDQLSGGATIVGLLLPHREPEADLVDDEVAELAARVIVRLRDRGVGWSGEEPLGLGDIGYVDAHVASNDRVRADLRSAGVGPEIFTTTPEIWQGLQRPLMVAKHTLSGTSRFDAFSLEPGRLCVMTSRHQLGLVLVGRDGVGDDLEEHAHDCADRPAGAPDSEWSGWCAHRALWSALEDRGRLVRV